MRQTPASAGSDPALISRSRSGLPTSPVAGLSTDQDARVLDADARPIDGLYAAGADAASIFRGTYPGPGTMIGPAIVFGWRAAMHAAGSPEQRAAP
jgi:predicted oxidoreductase